MKTPLLFSLALVIVAVGCGDNSGKPTTTATNASSSSGGSLLTAPVDYLASAAKAQQLATKQVDIVAVNQAIQLFQADKGRNPNDIDELVREKYLAKVPPVPFGTKLVYDPVAGTATIVKE